MLVNPSPCATASLTCINRLTHHVGTSTLSHPPQPAHPTYSRFTCTVSSHKQRSIHASSQYIPQQVKVNRTLAPHSEGIPMHKNTSERLASSVIHRPNRAFSKPIALRYPNIAPCEYILPLCLAKVEGCLVAFRVAHTDDLDIRRMLYVSHGLRRDENKLSPNRAPCSLDNHLHTALAVHAVHENITVAVRRHLKA